MMDANVLFRQLGGNRFRAMTGAKDFMKDGNSLRMKIMKNNTGGNHLIITLNSNDLYDMRFESHRLNRKTYELTVKVKAEETNIPASNLQSVFTRLSGLDTHMAEQSFSAEYEVVQIFPNGYEQHISIADTLDDAKKDIEEFPHKWRHLGPLEIKKRAEQSFNADETFEAGFRTRQPPGSARTIYNNNTVYRNDSQAARKALKEKMPDYKFGVRIVDGNTVGIYVKEGKTPVDMDTFIKKVKKIVYDAVAEGTDPYEMSLKGIWVQAYEGDFSAESFNADELEFTDWANQETKHHGKTSLKGWADHEIKKHGANMPFDEWAKHEDKSHIKRYGAEDEQIELQGNDGPSYAWDDVYYNCPICDERLSVFTNDTAECEFGNHADIVYSRNMLGSFEEYHWFHNIGGHENARNDYKDPEESDGIPVCGICDFTQSYSPDNMVEKDDGSWKCQSCGEITESFNAENSGFNPVVLCKTCGYETTIMGWPRGKNKYTCSCEKWGDNDIVVICKSCNKETTYRGYEYGYCGCPRSKNAESFNSDFTKVYCDKCNKKHMWDSGNDDICGLLCRNKDCGGSVDNPLHKGYHINAKKGASTFPACYFGAKCEKCETNPVAIVAYDDEPYHDEYCSQCWNTNNMVIEGAKQYYQSYNVIPAFAHEIKYMNRIAKKILNSENKSLPYKWIAGAIALGISLPYISSLLNSGREK